MNEWPLRCRQYKAQYQYLLLNGPITSHSNCYYDNGQDKNWINLIILEEFLNLAPLLLSESHCLGEIL